MVAYGQQKETKLIHMRNKSVMERVLQHVLEHVLLSEHTKNKSQTLCYCTPAKSKPRVVVGPVRPKKRDTNWDIALLGKLMYRESGSG